MRIAIIALLLFVINQNINAQTDYESLINKGLNLSYNAEFDAAEKVFSEAIKIESDNPVGYYNIAQIHSWEYAGTKDDEKYKSFMYWFEKTTKLTEEMLDKNPNDYRLTYLIANTYMLRAIAEVTDHSYMSAFFAIKSSSNYFNQTLQLNPKFYDAYRGVGEIHYFLDFIPGLVKWAVQLTGLEANKDKGLAELKIAYSKGYVDKVKSTLSLSEIYSDYIAEYDSSESLLRELTDEYPENSMFNYHLAVVLIKNRKLVEADKYLDKVLIVNNSQLTVLNNFSIFLKGDISFKLNDFQNSIKYNEEFLNKTKDKDYTGIANYRLALSYKILGNENKSKECLLNARYGNQDLYDDTFAKKRSDYYLEYGISQDELLTVKMKNSLEVGKYKDVYSSLKSYVDKIQDRNTRSKALVILSEASIMLGKYSEGIDYSKLCESINPKVESWIEPQAWYLIALGSYKMGNKEYAKNYLTKSEDSDEYKNNKLLYASINNLKRHLEK